MLYFSVVAFVVFAITNTSIFRLSLPRGVHSIGSVGKKRELINEWINEWMNEWKRNKTEKKKKKKKKKTNVKQIDVHATTNKEKS